MSESSASGLSARLVPSLSSYYRSALACMWQTECPTYALLLSVSPISFLFYLPQLAIDTRVADLCSLSTRHQSSLLSGSDIPESMLRLWSKSDLCLAPLPSGIPLRPTPHNPGHISPPPPWVYEFIDSLHIAAMPKSFSPASSSNISMLLWNFNFDWSFQSGHSNRH